MKTATNKVNQLFIYFVLAISLITCNSKIDKKEVKNLPVTATQAIVEDTQEKYKLGSQVPKDLVCMVNNAYMGKPQIPVPVNGKTYYGCCEMCVGTLNNNKSARIGIDPFSKKPIDKTEAYIVLIKVEGQVAYFESEQNFLKYKETLHN